MVDHNIVTRLREIHASALADAKEAGRHSPFARELLTELGQWLEGRFGASISPDSFQWGDVPIGGGGYIVNIRYNRHLQMAFAGTDVQNCYLRRKGDKKWATVFRRDTMRPEDMVRTAETNTKGHALASSQGDWAGDEGTRFYSHINAHVYTIDLDPSIPLTETGGIECRRWKLPAKFMQANLGFSKMFGQSIAGHRTNKDIAAVGTWNDGVYYTMDGGKTVHEVDVPPCFGGLGTDKGRERIFVGFGPAGEFYVFIQGHGLFRADDVTQKPVLVAGGPPRAAGMTVEDNGTVLICGDPRLPNDAGTGYRSSPVDPAIAGVWEYDGEFRHLGNGLVRWGHAFPTHVARDPFDANRLVAWHEQIGGLSLDGGKTWRPVRDASGANGVVGGEAEWRVRNGVFLGGGLEFTEEPDVMIGGEGFGVITFTPPTPIYDAKSGKERLDQVSGVQGTDMSAGIEEFIVNYIWVNPANGRLFLNCWDRHIVEVTDIDRYNARVMMPADTRLSIAHGMDNAIDDPDYYVCSGGSGTPSHSWSQGGREWKKFAETTEERRVAYPDRAGNGSAGAIAMSERDDIVICQSNNLPAVETRKERDPETGLLIFRQIGLNGSTNYSTINSYTTAYRKNVSADKLRPGVFGMVVPTTDPSVSNSVSNPLGGLWIRDGVDAEWKQTRPGRIGSYGEKAQFWNMDFKFIPGREAEMLLTGYIGQANAPLVHLFEDGRREVEIANIRNVNKFGFGRNPGQTYPAVMFLGEWKGERGYWLTLDWFATAMKLSDEYPNNYWSSGCSSIAGDMSEDGFGKWFVAVSGKGAVYAKVAE